MKRVLISILLLTGTFVLLAQKTLPAVRISQAPKIDGSLDDEVWKNIPVASDFIQNFPTYGLPAGVKTEVKIAYDNNAIFIGAYLYDDPTKIRKQLTARDGEQRQDVDYFSVFFDTYNDNQNGFQFLVTSANVQSDARLGPNLDSDFGEYGDKTWEAVWESKVGMKADGWVVEMRIPYISLRFAKKDVQNWGLQFLRFTRRNNETSFWNPVSPQVNGFVNQFGDYTGLTHIEPPLRLSFSPYVSGGFRSTPEGSGYKTEGLRNGGMDLKWGVNESHTLDATIIPDFGQVISDNAINNLSPFEIRFQENRPFFTEGTELFNKAGLFYSRRVGSTPSGYNAVKNFVASNSNWEIIKNPSVTQLYNAAKFSGRNPKKLGIGFFNAVTAPMEAKIRNTSNGKDSLIQTEPLANYNILVIDQALKGRSFVTLTNTNVIRNGNARDANVTALDLALYDKTNTYALNATGRYSKIFGLNPYDGYNTTLRFSKVSGNWQWMAQGNVESDKYDPNDLGILFAANEATYLANFGYRSFKPTKNFLTYSYTLESRLQYLYKPYAFSRYDISGSAFWVFRNFWDISINTNITPGWEQNYFELRTPWKVLRYPSNYIFEMNGSSDSRKKLYLSYGATYATAPRYNNTYSSVSLGLRYRFSNRFLLDLNGTQNEEINQLGYAFQRETNGDPIVGFRNNKTFTTILSGIYNFTPRMNLTLRTRHYWNKVHYISFHNVDNEGYLTARPFIPYRDENFNIFNIDAFFTWDFRLGSRIILGWKNWLEDNASIDISNKRYGSNLARTLNISNRNLLSRHGNEVTLRFIYFLDYNQFRKK